MSKPLTDAQFETLAILAKNGTMQRAQDKDCPAGLHSAVVYRLQSMGYIKQEGQSFSVTERGRWRWAAEHARRGSRRRP